MMLCIVFALVNGIAIGTGRALNGRLSASTGPFRASLWNHVVGFLLLSVMLLLVGWPQASYASLPVEAYLGGVFGALFVAVNSLVFTRLGATRAALLVIGGQMATAVAIDWQHQQQAPGLLRCVGLAVLLLGMCLSRTSREKLNIFDRMTARQRR